VLRERFPALDTFVPDGLLGLAFFIRTSYDQKCLADVAVIAKESVFTAFGTLYPKRSAAGGAFQPAGFNGRAAFWAAWGF
jgi:hypothetical protein